MIISSAKVCFPDGFFVNQYYCLFHPHTNVTSIQQTFNSIIQPRKTSLLFSIVLTNTLLLTPILSPNQKTYTNLVFHSDSLKYKVWKSKIEFFVFIGEFWGFPLAFIFPARQYAIHCLESNLI
jgi:hypothetical protein